ncbi:hypothetical protein ACFL2A_04040 [Thermodesulfobacteriota bacterium]
MKVIDVKDLKDNPELILELLKEENVVLTKHGKPITLIQKFDGSVDDLLSKNVVQSIFGADKNTAAQYSAMMQVWGDPACDIYDEAFIDD